LTRSVTKFLGFQLIKFHPIESFPFLAILHNSKILQNLTGDRIGSTCGFSLFLMLDV